MKSAKQNYITIGSDGTVLPQGKPRKAAEPVGESADVAYRLARMAEEAAASLPIAPNAHDAADAADYTAVPRALATAARIFSRFRIMAGSCRSASIFSSV